jgi:isopenicillin-N N-acyltransferase-like protein
MMRSLSTATALLILLAALATPAGASEPFRYPEGKYGKGELKYINGLPVVFITGSPEELGEQMAHLIAKPAVRLLDFPRDFLKSEGSEAAYPFLVFTARAMLSHFPDDYRKELESAVKTSGLNRDAVIVGNTMFDIKKLTGCSTLQVEAARSATRQPLFGRNLDLPTLGYLHEYSLVLIAHPDGKHAFASVNFPGLLGCLSGMNDAGLTLAALEVFSSRDGAAKFDAGGVPYALSYRRVLEECTTVAEAEKLLRSIRRTTMNNLAICDKHEMAIFEITPKSIVVRRPLAGICACTNHFRTPELASSLQCKRFDALEKCRDQASLNIPDIIKRLHAANQGEMTLQTMIFEPATLRLHLAIGKGPTSALPLRVLELAPLLAKE